MLRKGGVSTTVKVRGHLHAFLPFLVDAFVLSRFGVRDVSPNGACFNVKTIVFSSFSLPLQKIGPFPATIISK